MSFPVATRSGRVSRNTRSARLIESGNLAALDSAPVPPPPLDSLPTHLGELAGRARTLSEALAVALADVVRDPTAVRACGRVLGVDKNLAWRLVRLSEASDLASVLSSRPGSRGWNLARSALVRAGCKASLVDSLSAAREAFEQEIVDRRIDGQTLRFLAYGGLETDKSRTEIRKIRRDAAEMAAIRFGTRAHALVTSYLATPTGEDDLLDLCSMTMLLGLRRIGPGPNLEIHRGTVTESDSRMERFCAAIGAHRGAGSLVTSLSSPDAAEQLIVTADPARSIVHFRGDEASPAAGIDLTFIESLPRAAYTFARHAGEIGSYGAPVLVPTAWFVLEVLVDRSVRWGGTAEAAMFSQIAGPSNRVRYFDPQRLPMVETPESGASTLLPPELEGWRALHRSALERAAAAAGRELADFEMHRLTFAHPPLSTNLVMRWRLPIRAASETP